MNVCVVGAGAIGGLIAARMALAGIDVTVVDRGAHLAAIRKHGLRLHLPDGRVETAAVRAAASFKDAGQPGVVVLALKAHQITGVAPQLPALLGPKSVVVTIQNGLPWWYFHRHGGEFEGRTLEMADPGGVIARHLDPARVIGAIAYPGAEVVAPGEVRLVEGDRFPVGEPDGSESERVAAVSALFQRAGFKSPVLTDIRAEIWLKAWGNLSFNPISALTHATLADICRYPLTRELAARMMREAQQVAERLGITFRLPVEKRIEGAEKVGAHKTSMLQDIEHGRTLEADALVGTVIELGGLVGVPTPTIDAVYALVKLLGRQIEARHGYVRLLAEAA
ncbi:MAG: 2-dehydropantoate 2-reductase [Pseudomonadota bacterium]